MDDRNIEQNLKDSADKIETKDFSERWEVISERISIDTEMDKAEVKVAVLVEASGVNTSQSPIKKNLLISFCALFLVIAVILAIVLPVVLNRNETPSYFAPNQLESKDVSENEFYDQTVNSGMDLVDFSGFEIDVFVLSYTPDGELAGGRVEVVDEECGVIAQIYFYKDIVNSFFDVGPESKEYDMDGLIVEYNTALDDEFYNTKAKTKKNKISYNIDCLSLEEDIGSFFEKLFV